MPGDGIVSQIDLIVYRRGLAQIIMPGLLEHRIDRIRNRLARCFSVAGKLVPIHFSPRGVGGIFSELAIHHLIELSMPLLM